MNTEQKLLNEASCKHFKKNNNKNFNKNNLSKTRSRKQKFKNKPHQLQLKLKIRRKTLSKRLKNTKTTSVSATTAAKSSTSKNGIWTTEVQAEIKQTEEIPTAETVIKPMEDIKPVIETPVVSQAPEVPPEQPQEAPVDAQAKEENTRKKKIVRKNKK